MAKLLSFKRLPRTYHLSSPNVFCFVIPESSIKARRESMNGSPIFVIPESLYRESMNGSPIEDFGDDKKRRFPLEFTPDWIPAFAGMTDPGRE